MSSVPAYKPRFLLANTLFTSLKPIALRCSYAPSPFYTNELCHSKSRLRIEYGVTKESCFISVRSKKSVSLTCLCGSHSSPATVPLLKKQSSLLFLNAPHLWADLTTLLAIYDGNDNLLQRFEYTNQRVPTAMTSNGTKYYLHYDQVGSLRAISDISGNIIKEITYDTYGNILSDTNTNFKVPFGFAGGLYDTDTKLTRFGYRDYDAYTGKWTAKDPIDFNGGDTNLYGYVLGDPVNFVDPRGEMIPLVPIIVAGVVIYLVYDTVSDWYHYLDESIDDIDKNQECLGANDYLDNYEKDYRKRVNNQLNRSRNIGKETTNDVLKAGYPLGKALDAAEGITYEFSK